MEIIKYPQENDWGSLAKRPELKLENLTSQVSEIFAAIQRNGDNALRSFTKVFDGVEIENFLVLESEFEEAIKRINPDLKNAITLAKENIERFHISQVEEKKIVETSKGVSCWRESRPIENVGLYIPGGTAPLFSTVLMLAIPARLASCKEVIICTPPDKNGKIHPAILYAASLCNVKSVYKLGGIQAIGALTFGTETIPKVDKVFGPGNQYVTAAKQLAQNFGVAIDMPAGPSEVLIIADKNANPDFVAADLLSQAEHGGDSQVILISDEEDIILKSLACLNSQLEFLPRKAIAEKALRNSKAILLKSLNECIQFSNLYAPEHLILAVENAIDYVSSIVNAGSVFLGNYSCESAGDYASGTNHTLPTNTYARNYSGVSLESFQKRITFQEVSKEGLINIGPSIEIMADTEQLVAHKNAVTIRLNSITNENN